MSFSTLHSRSIASQNVLSKPGRTHLTPARSSRTQLQVRADSVLIANTKSGGHAFIGLHLAKQLLSAGHKVTILNDGDQAKQTVKAPFSQYKDLEQQGATVVWGNPADAASIPEGDFDIVYDNNGKSMDVCQPMIDHFKGKVSHYVFVGSAGAYVPRKLEAGHVEGDERKASAGHVEVEKYLEQQDLPYTVFQPLYIYGPHTAKDCEQWFFERVLRDRPVPIPAPGVQLTSISHVEDVAAMLAKVPGNKAAIKQHFNVCSDRCISFDGIVQTVAKAAGKDAKIVHYDDGKTGLKKGQGFPFRTVHFFAHSDKAKHVLDWQPQHDFVSDLPQLLDAFKSSGRLDKEFDASTDDAIINNSEAVLA